MLLPEDIAEVPFVDAELDSLGRMDDVHSTAFHRNGIEIAEVDVVGRNVSVVELLPVDGRIHHTGLFGMEECNCMGGPCDLHYPFVLPLIG